MNEHSFLDYLLKHTTLQQEQVQNFLNGSQSLFQILISKKIFTDRQLEEYLVAFQQTQSNPLLKTVEATPSLVQTQTQTGLDLLVSLTNSTKQINEENQPQNTTAIQNAITEFGPLGVKETTQKTEKNIRIAASKTETLITLDETNPLMLKASNRLRHAESPIKSELGKYKIIEEIARGGMGTVYKVLHQELGQIYALKVLQVKEGISEELIERFHLEAQITAKLKHPNIVQLVDFDHSEDQHYLCMEFIEGETLEAFLKRKESPRKFLILLKKCLEALHYAHQKGILHRDLKPANIFVTSTGEPKIVDFGVAKDLGRTTEEQQLTAAGQILGTPLYMSPEQLSGKASEIDALTDVYSMGICLYQGLSHKLPFQAKSIHQLFFHILSKDVLLPSKHNPEIHRDLDTIILKAINRDKKKRYQSAAEFAEEIGRFLDGYPILAKPISPIERSLKWFKRNRHSILPGIFIFLLLTFLFLSNQWNQYQKKQKHFHSLLKKAETEIESSKKIPTLGKKQITQKIKFLLNALTSLNKALSLYPQETQVEQKKFTLGKDLIKLACQNEQYDLADYITREIESLYSVSENEKKVLQTQTIEARAKQLKQHISRLEFWIQKLQKPKQEKGNQEKALLEISKMQEEEVLTRLIQILQEGVQYFTAGKAVRSANKDAFYETMVLALGQLENPKAGKPIIQALKKMNQSIAPIPAHQRPLAEIQYMIALVQALENVQTPDTSEALRSILDEHGEEGIFWKQGRLVYQKLLQKDGLEKFVPKSATEFNDRGILREDAGDLPGALKDYQEAIRLNPEFADAYNNLGNAYSLGWELEKAIENYSKAIQYQPENPLFYQNRGLTQADSDQSQMAINDFNKAIELNPNYAEAYYNRGLVQEELGDENKALLDYSKAIEINPQYSEALNARGNLKGKQGKLDAALIDLTRAIHLNPQDSNPYRNRGVVYFEKDNETQALKDFNKAIRLNPEEAQNYLERAHLKLYLEDLQGAVQDFTQALNLDEEAIDAYFQRGAIFHRLKKLESAEKDFQKALKLLADDKDEEAEDYRRQIYQLLPKLKKK